MTTLTPGQITKERWKCRRSPHYFIDNYCHTLTPGQNGKPGAWERITLWPHQQEGITALHTHDRLIVLKARQLGITWMVLFYIVWLMVWRSISTTLVFSRTDDEAMDLLDVRIKGIWERLPEWMKDAVVPNKTTDNKHHWKLSGGSSCTAFSTKGGDGRTGSLALVDEADLCPNLATMMGSIEPTIGDGGKIVLISRAEKGSPDSTFKRIWRDARAGGTYHPIFLPWWARPGRTKEWYADRVRESLAKDGTLDTVHKQYPATEQEALEADSVGKRLPQAWLQAVFQQGECQDPDGLLPGVRIYADPIPGHRYVMGVDPAEGVPGGDDSALCLIDDDTGRQVAAANVRVEPRAFARLCFDLAERFNDADIMVERNNHGHAVIGFLEDLGASLLEYDDDVAGGAGFGDGRIGYPKTGKSKAIIWDSFADAIRIGGLVIVDYATLTQLGSINRASLKGPPGSAVDDLADAATLAEAGRQTCDFLANIAKNYGAGYGSHR